MQKQQGQPVSSHLQRSDLGRFGHTQGMRLHGAKRTVLLSVMSATLLLVGVAPHIAKLVCGRTDLDPLGPR